MQSRRHLANAIRALSMDAVQAANSGHPGMPMGMADIAEVLWRDFLHHNPNNPNWTNRDRFVLSNGHGAMLLYSLLHLTGYELTIEDLKQFRQLHSKTPGHPEYGDTPGVETTTGPLGQGLANSVGMAIAERLMATRYNRPDFDLIDHFTYAFCGDGCLMEGISHEACSLAGTLGLGKLIVLYDDNGISIDGDVTGWFTDDTVKRFEAYGWQVLPQVDGHDAEAVAKAIREARAEGHRPSLICCKTQIGFGAPNLAGSAASHGAPLGLEEVAAARRQLDWSHEPFSIPKDVYAAWDARDKGQQLEQAWQDLFNQYQQEHPQLAAELTRRLKGELPPAWGEHCEKFLCEVQAQGKAMATRKASLQCLNSVGPLLPELIGGSADLTGSNCTAWSDSKILTHDDFSGNYIEYGVREFAMSAIMNGMALYGGFIPYSGTFLTFTDYARNAVRLSALMKQKVIQVYTHDSIGLGEDGPTHQPIEHAAMLRLTPGINVWRPADLPETAVAWQHSIEYQGPSCLLLTRQNVPHYARDSKTLANIERGGYILFEPQAVKLGEQTLDAIIIATGSEVALAMAAAEKLQSDDVQVRVVSMPCCEVFKVQEQSYQQQVLPRQIKARVAIEAGVPDGWYQYVGEQGKVIGIQRFGMSAPADEVYKALGLTSERLVEAVMSLLSTQQVRC